MLTDIIGENISYTRKHLNYILVYNETKNPDDENIDVKTADAGVAGERGNQ